ncbi:MAG: hypothetical protein H7039_16915 [Bryobacteraceae bacterium]|nr:hypothetical protein [Bryobacteraceae bacterium]
MQPRYHSLDALRAALLLLGLVFYLCLTYGVFKVPGWTLKDLYTHAGFDYLHRASVAILATLTLGVVLTMPSRTLETSFAIWPLHVRSLAAYFLFFLFGWVLFFKREVLPDFARFGAGFCLLATIPLALYFYAARRSVEAVLGTHSINPVSKWSVVAAAMAAVTVSLLAYGLIGLFVRYFERPSRAVLPWDAPAIVKVLTNLVISLGVLLLSYEYFVRRTIIGTFLNGRRSQMLSPERSLAAAAGSSGRLMPGTR